MTSSTAIKLHFLTGTFLHFITGVDRLRLFETCAEKEDILLVLEDLLNWSVEALKYKGRASARPAYYIDIVGTLRTASPKLFINRQ